MKTDSKLWEDTSAKPNLEEQGAQPRFYLAPLEGITTFIYRNTYREMFGGMDKYFTPFIAPSSSHNFKSKEKRDVLPENNEGTPLVPQILTNHPEDFLYTAGRLMEYGYTEINLNLGCPSGTVVSKGRGSGFLAYPQELDRFLERLYEKTEVALSIKTRLGKEDPEEFLEIIRIYNKYPVHELTIHPRVQKDFYNNKPDWDMFERALELSKNPVCYNGDINTCEDYERFRERFPAVDRIMIGRGIVADPGLVRQIRTGKKLSEMEYLAFMQRLCVAYNEIMPGQPALYKMKEIWSYMCRSWPDGMKLWKRIKKTKNLEEYKNVIRSLCD